MRRKCEQCGIQGIRVGRIVQTGPLQCELCGTEYEVTRFRNVPYAVTGVLAAAFVLALLAGHLNGVVVLALGGVWLVFDVVWELVKPLRPSVRTDAEM